MDGKTPPVQKRRGVGVIFLILAPQDVSVPRSVLNLRWYSTKIVTQQRRVSRIYPMLHVIISFMLSRRGSGRRVERMKGECRQKQTKNNDGKGVPLRLNDGDTKEKKKEEREERDKWIKKGKIETRRWSEWSEIQRVLGVSLFSWLPSSPSFSYGNPSSSTELLGSPINQRLYEIPAGAKGQRRKLAAVFSSPFMLAAGLIAKCAISLISTLKQTPRQAGEELFARSYILWHRILFQEGGGGWRRRSGASSGIEDEGDGGGRVSSHSFYTLFSLLPSSAGVSEGKQWSASLSLCPRWSALAALGGAAMIADLPSAVAPKCCHSLTKGPVNSGNLFTHTQLSLFFYRSTVEPPLSAFCRTTVR